jgi:hypothetical protein
VYDPDADRWRPLDALLPVGRASFSAATLSGRRGHDDHDDHDGHGDHRDADRNDHDRDRDDTIIAFGGFRATEAQPEASAVVESLRVRRR